MYITGLAVESYLKTEAKTTTQGEELSVQAALKRSRLE